MNWPIPAHVGGSSNGRTADSDSVNLGSSPSPPANLLRFIRKIFMQQVNDNTALQRFELEESGHIAFADYRRSEGVLTLTHVEAPPALRGSGAAGRLMEGIMNHAHTEGILIVPLCSYAAAWIERHPEHHNLLA